MANKDQQTFSVTMEIVDDRIRPVFFCETPSRSYVGDWENNTADLSRQIAREFQRWIEA